jgi:hypothetical protein
MLTQSVQMRAETEVPGGDDHIGRFTTTITAAS